MDEDETVSVSKGVFVFKNNFKPSKNSKKSKRETKSKFSSHLWYKTYSEFWTDIEGQLEALNSEAFSEIIDKLIEFIITSREDTMEEIPTATLLTGINMPDHEVQFKALSKQIRQVVSQNIAVLNSQDCQNIKVLMESMIGQFVNKKDLVDDDDEEQQAFKKNQLNLSLLECWYENRPNKSPLVVILPDFASFNPQVLQQFILTTSWYIKTLPFVFIFGIATSINILHSYLPHHVLSKMYLKIFHSQPSIVYLNEVLDNIFLNGRSPFLLGGKVFNLLIDIFLFYDLSVNNFIQNLKLSALEHFSYGNAMALCDLHKRITYSIIDGFSHSDFETIRRLPSFRKLVESSEYEVQIKLLNDDDYFQTVLNEEIVKLQKYIRRLFLFLNSLLLLVKDLPKFPLGKQIREIYSVVVSKNLTQTEEYKECFQLLNYLSKDELTARIKAIVEHLSTIIKANQTGEMSNYLNTLSDYLEQLTNFNLDEIMDVVEEMGNGIDDDDVVFVSSDRKQFKEKLLSYSSKKNKSLNKYEKLRSEILEYISGIFSNHLVSPKSYYFHEIFFFDDLRIKNKIIGSHRAAIHNALNDPQYYLQCKCCSISNPSSILPSMPDICIAYKLHLECGKMINLYDWLQAFLTVINPEIHEVDSDKVVVEPQMQARFTQAVAELEYLGFIKNSKRKADHMMRLTWGG